MWKEKKETLLLSMLIILLLSCNSKQYTEVPVHFERYDQAVFSKELADLAKDYPEFTSFYLENIIKVGTLSDSTTVAFFNTFKDTYKNDVYNSVTTVFPSMKNIEKELGKAIGNYKNLFPNDSIPEFYTHFSGFNESIISTGNIISVSLENYLGESKFYDELGIYKYLRNGMHPEKIPVDIVKTLLLQKINPNNATDNLLATMIYQGKMYYVLSEIFPEKSIAFLLNFTKKQEKWCKANEPTMWSYLIENKHLFSSDYRTIRNYIDPAPFTKGFPDESPGQTGVWIGYQIIAHYMKNTETSLAELINTTDYQSILQQSAYNPE